MLEIYQEMYTKWHHLQWNIPQTIKYNFTNQENKLTLTGEHLKHFADWEFAVNFDNQLLLDGLTALSAVLTRLKDAGRAWKIWNDEHTLDAKQNTPAYWAQFWIYRRQLADVCMDMWQLLSVSLIGYFMWDLWKVYTEKNEGKEIYFVSGAEFASNPKLSNVWINETSGVTDCVPGLRWLNKYGFNVGVKVTDDTLMDQWRLLQMHMWHLRMGLFDVNCGYYHHMHLFIHYWEQWQTLALELKDLLQAENPWEQYKTYWKLDDKFKSRTTATLSAWED